MERKKRQTPTECGRFSTVVIEGSFLRVSKSATDGRDGKYEQMLVSNRHSCFQSEYVKYLSLI